MIYKNISYMISHIFLMMFMYLFISHRYSRAKTAGICVSSFLALSISDLLKLNIFADSRLCYGAVTVFQILLTQFTGLFISKKRDSRVLFMGLSASNYVIAGSITATILHIWTGSTLVSMIGSVVVHVAILLNRNARGFTGKMSFLSHISRDWKGSITCWNGRSGT